MSEAKFKHYLKFNDLPLIGTIEISEPFKFDGSSISVEQEKGKHSRNLTIFNPNTSLELNRSNFELLISNQILPDGTIFDYASQGFDYVKKELNLRGFEVNIEYILEYEGSLYSTGKLDGLTWTIQKDVITFNIVQNTLMKRIKVNEDIAVDAFSDKDLEGNDIEPCQTHNIFLKAKPTFQNSLVESRDIAGLFQDSALPSEAVTIMNYGQNIVRAGVQSTLTPFEPVTYIDGTNPADPKIRPFRFVKLKTNATNIRVRHTVNMTYNITSGAFAGFSVVALYLVYGSEAEFSIGNSNPKRIVLYNDTNPDGTVKTVNLNQTFEYTIPEMSNEDSVWLMWYIVGEADANINGVVYDMSNEVELTSTAVSTVIKGIRLSDLLQHMARSLNFNLNDTVFGAGTEYYNNFVMNGRMLGNLSDLPFNNKLKELLPSFCDEAFADYQVNDENVTIKKINEFYNDIELAVFEEIPALSNNEKPNVDYAIKQFNVGFKSSSDARIGNAQDTIDDVHTSMQINFPSENVDGVFNLNFNHIRSCFLGEEQRRRGNEVEEKTKALENDDKLFVYDCIELPPNTQNVFTQFLTYQVTSSTNRLKILSNGTFNWNNLGITVNQNLIAENTFLTGGFFKVIDITPFIIELEFLNNFPTVDLTGEGTFTFIYTLTGVNHINRTNEGFELIEGVENPDNYSNLRFTLKRILNKWKSVLSIASQFLPNKELKVTEIKVNNKLKTRLAGESETVVDFDPILTNDIVNDKFLDGKIYTYKVFSRFDHMLTLANRLRDEAGYVRILTSENTVVKGFVNKMDFKIQSQELDLTLFGKFENDVIELSPYASQIGTFEVVNGFVTIYDANGLKLFNTNYIFKFSINGNVYTDEVEFSENLLNLLP